MKKFLWTILFVIFLPLFISIYFLGFTSSGLAWDIHLLKKFLPGELAVEYSQGALLNDFTLENLNYHYGEHHVVIKKLRVDWNPLGLLLTQLMINHLEMTDATLNLKNHQQSTETSTPIDIKAWMKHLHIKTFNINHLNVTTDQLTFHLEGTITHHWNCHWQLAIKDLNLLSNQVRGALQSTGEITGEFNKPQVDIHLQTQKLIYGDININQLNGDINLRIEPRKNSKLSLQAQQIKINSTRIPSLKLNLAGNVFFVKNSLHMIIEGALDDYPINATFKLPKFTRLTDLEQPIVGNIQTNTRQLGIVSKFIDSIKEPSGLLNLNIALKGPLKQPSIVAHFDLSDAQFSIPALGIKPNHITIKSELGLNRIMDFNGSLALDNTASLEGKLDLSAPSPTVTLRLTGTNLTVSNLPEYKIKLSPNLNLIFKNNNLDIQGSVGINEAKISPKRIDETVTLPDEVVFTNRKKAKVSLPFTTSLKVDVSSQGDNIFVSAFDLTATVKGKVTISQHPGADIMALGELTITRGLYQAYGQSLTITDGKLVYTGGLLTNPGINIAATKQIRTAGNVGRYTSNSTLDDYSNESNLTVGIRVQGFLDEPRLTLFSRPMMSQNDILSYLVFGYASSQTTGQQSMALMGLLTTMTGKNNQIGGLPSQLSDVLGGAEFNIESVQSFNPTTSALESNQALSIGKQLGKNLFLHYSIGLFSPVSIFSIRYQFRKNWAIESETSSLESGGDIFYTIERD